MRNAEGGTIQNIDELEFIFFCIDGVAAKLGVPTEKVYLALTRNSDILFEYIVPEYSILHTQGKEYIVDDILNVMQEKGVKV